MTGAPVTMLAFFLYCALEGTTGLWASSFLVLRHNIAAESAASMASLFYIGITAGRFLSGFISDKLQHSEKPFRFWRGSSFTAAA